MDDISNDSGPRSRGRYTYTTEAWCPAPPGSVAHVGLLQVTSDFNRLTLISLSRKDGALHFCHTSRFLSIESSRPDTKSRFI